MPTILIVEDDFLIADMLESSLSDHGYEVCGIARTVSEAVALIREHSPDLAVIDLRLADDEPGTEIVARLGGIGRLGVLYASGNISKLRGTEGHASIAKPYRDIDLLRGLEIVAELVATGTASPPFPRGFQVLKPSPLHRTYSIIT